MPGVYINSEFQNFKISLLLWLPLCHLIRHLGMGK